MVVKKCLICGEDFNTKYSMQKICSSEFCLERFKKLQKMRKKDYGKDYYQKNKEKWYARRLSGYERKRYWKIRKKIIAILGNKCIICEKSNPERIIIYHEIYGKPHESNPLYTLNHIEDFVPMCKFCHKVLHVFLKNREKFIQLLRTVRKLKDE